MPEANAPSANRLELRGIRKSYAHVLANDGIDLKVLAGEIHAVLGENGAGKSTLVKIAYGAVRPDAGEILWDGMSVVIPSPAKARQLGIGMVFQHLSLFETLTAAENIALAIPGKSDLRSLSKRIETLGARYGLAINPAQAVYSMSVGERQRVEIIRALLQRPRLLIMDEPTSVLAPQAVEKLFETLRQLAAEGCSILYISHKLDEVKELCRTATVLRGGRVAAVCDPRRETEAALARLMIGRDIPNYRRDGPAALKAPLLVVEKLSAKPDDPFGSQLTEISFELHSGEIAGIAGISGNGQRELMSLLSGETPCPKRNAIFLAGRSVGDLGPRERRKLGLCFVPEERLSRGAVPALSLADNGLLTANDKPMVRAAMIRAASVKAFAENCITAYEVKCAGVYATAKSLSGGNLQKFIVGRELLQRPRVLLISQPTWGVDVGAAVFIRQALLDLKKSGAAILCVSEELEELFEICDRVAVIARGRLSPLKPVAETNAAEIGLAMTGIAVAPNPSGAVTKEGEVRLVH